mmetsp:Transcript_12089/g.15766  ORF Transcript_12089/g.15766 Transcript_12089/m.15766 type:complete len:198 (+) Transcript_12089:145-738(+)|eukprot:CAMPEP_0116069072 /NCGR_PEP_ID=MMETSP0322-20121206/12059_1 /TAXON_ID=163516 /ORGANISM="Leptocylindrus danicus var. apora, Strain B651" /LENGTH=197 /DNA_ID=CAMNT_0003556345 /DNA_START=71 /DNA_END=661 /DNA_ORIENTATION=-
MSQSAKNDCVDIMPTTSTNENLVPATGYLDTKIDQVAVDKYADTISIVDPFLHFCSTIDLVYLNEHNHKCIFPCIDMLQEKYGHKAVYIELNYRPFIDCNDFVAIIAFQDLYPDRVNKFTKSSAFDIETAFSNENLVGFEDDTHDDTIEAIRKLPLAEQELVLYGACQILTFNYLATIEKKDFMPILKSFGRILKKN